MTWIKIFQQNWNGCFSNISHKMMVQLTPIISISKKKEKWNKRQKIRNWLLNSRLQTHQILRNNDPMCILCFSYKLLLYMKSMPKKITLVPWKTYALFLVTPWNGKPMKNVSYKTYFCYQLIRLYCAVT